MKWANWPVNATPGGHFVAHDHRHIPDALAETRKVLEEGTAPALFEAAFVHQGLFARADVIERLPGGRWRLIEVKSTTRLKDVFVLDVAFQLCVLRGAGLDVRDAAVMTLDRSYVYDGKRLDLDALFKLHGVFEQAEAFLDTVGSQARGDASIGRGRRSARHRAGQPLLRALRLPFLWPLHSRLRQPRTRHRRTAVAEVQPSRATQRRGY